MRIVKIRTKRGQIITLTVSEITPTHYIGVDKFGEEVVIPKKEMDSLHTVENDETE